jgi:hypothetical protein
MDEGRTLDELDPPAWGPPTYPSGTVLRSHELRTKPLGDFTAGDLRFMIGQQVALSHLIPRAIVVLDADPLIECEYFPGDLLEAVLSVDERYWQDNREQWYRVIAIADIVTSAYEELIESIVKFRSIYP